MLHINIVDYVFEDVTHQDINKNGRLRIGKKVIIRGNYRKSPVEVKIPYYYIFDYTHRDVALFHRLDECLWDNFDTEEECHLFCKKTFSLPDNWQDNFMQSHCSKD